MGETDSPSANSCIKVFLNTSIVIFYFDTLGKPRVLKIKNNFLGMEKYFNPLVTEGESIYLLPNFFSTCVT